MNRNAAAQANWRAKHGTTRHVSTKPGTAGGKIIEYLREHGPSHVNEITAGTGLSRWSVTANVAGLLRARHVERHSRLEGEFVREVPGVYRLPERTGQDGAKCLCMDRTSIIGQTGERGSIMSEHRGREQGAAEVIAAVVAAAATAHPLDADPPRPLTPGEQARWQAARAPHEATWRRENDGGFLVTCPHGCNLGTAARTGTEAGALNRIRIHRLATEVLVTAVPTQALPSSAPGDTVTVNHPARQDGSAGLLHGMAEDAPYASVADAAARIIELAGPAGGWRRYGPAAPQPGGTGTTFYHLPPDGSPAGYYIFWSRPQPEGGPGRHGAQRGSR